MERFIDCHNDCLTYFKKDKKLFKYLSSFENVKLILAVWTTELNSIEAINLMQKAKKLSCANDKFLTSFEDLHFATSENLSIIADLAPDFTGLVWNNDNSLAGGAYGTNGLTQFGEIVLNRLEQAGTIIDTAHMNEKSFIDVAKITNNPIFCSHTAFYDICNSPRNLKDYQCKIIEESNGFVGLCFVSSFVSGSKHSNIDDIIEHIDYFATKFNINNIGFGTDFYGTKHLPKCLKSYKDIKNLEQRMLQVGFSNDEINKVFHQNFEDFMLRAKS